MNDDVREFDRMLVRKFPSLPWSEPIAVKVTGMTHEHYGCRLCIARLGLKGGDVSYLPTDRARVIDHLRNAHNL